MSCLVRREFGSAQEGRSLFFLLLGAVHKIIAGRGEEIIKKYPKVVGLPKKKIKKIKQENV